MPVKLCVNIDHIATVRQARRDAAPDPVEGARLAEKAGALLLLAATLAVGLRPEWLLRQIVPALSSPWFHAALNGGAR